VEVADVLDVVADRADDVALHDLHVVDVAQEVGIRPCSREQAELDPAKSSVHLV
jgi:hypothetical protein